MEKPPRYTDVQFCNRAILGWCGIYDVRLLPIDFLRRKFCRCSRPFPRLLGRRLLIFLRILLRMSKKSCTFAA